MAVPTGVEQATKLVTISITVVVPDSVLVDVVPASPYTVVVMIGCGVGSGVVWPGGGREPVPVGPGGERDTDPVGPGEWAEPLPVGPLGGGTEPDDIR